MYEHYDNCDQCNKPDFLFWLTGRKWLCGTCLDNGKALVK